MPITCSKFLRQSTYAFQSTQPHCRIANLVEADIAKRQTASVYLKQLTEIGVLKEMKVGRDKLFIHPKLISVITRSNQFRKYR